jgi:hypothetical protein
MKTAILYYSPEPLAGAPKPPGHHQAIHTTLNDKPVSLWIRLEVVEGDTLHALDHAKPLPGETVLNTVALEDAK